jgi:hypothetical protein
LPIPQSVSGAARCKLKISIVISFPIEAQVENLLIQIYEISTANEALSFSAIGID